MLSKLKNHLSKNVPFLAEKKLLLAVSGGLDSMVLTALFQELNYSIAIAHCNFQLRDKQSDEDEVFLATYAKKHEIPFFVTRFDTTAFAEDFKLSIQVAARELRYKWFYELAEKHDFDYILTAHHADDNLETFLINLSRGTGLEGLTGIPKQNNKIIRPLLSFSRNDIENYAKEHALQWREDGSNASDYYLRNKIRHHIAPLLKELNPNFLASFENTLEHLEQSQTLVNDATILVYQQVVSEDQNQKIIDIEKLKKLPNHQAYLYQWLKPFGFSAWNDINNLVESQTGKQVFSDGFRLLKDRDRLILSPKNDNEDQIFQIDENQTEINFPLKLSFCKVADISNLSNTTIFVNQEKLQYPLIIRKWAQGDSFQPFGMDGQSKKVSKLLKDEKISLHAKENVWLLCSGETIIWVIGIRQDERFKIENTTQTILQIKLL